MTNHPGRLKPSHGLHPSPGEIAQTQREMQHTNREAAECIGVAERTWEDYRGGKRKMPPGLWLLYCLQCAFPREMQRLIARLSR